jgi:hypothetical protein
MTTRIALLTVVALCLFGAACFSVLLAGDAAPNNWQALEKNYAHANLALAKARLAQAQAENASDAGSVSGETIDALEAGVQLAQAKLKQLEAGTGADDQAAQILAAEQELLGLENDYKDSLKANQIQAGAVPEPNLRREEAEIEVAKARLAALKSLAQQPPEVRIQWQIGQLHDEIRALWARPLIED